MSKRTQVIFFAAAFVLVGLSLGGVLGNALEAIGVAPDSVQVADAVVGLAGLIPLVLLWLSDQKRERLAAERVSVFLVSQDGRRLELPYKPPRREITTRAGLFGVLGGIAGARRFDVGHALLNVVSSGAYDRLCDGRSSSIEIPVPDREFEEFSADAEAFSRGEVRKPAGGPPPAPKPPRELGEILERLSRIEARLNPPPPPAAEAPVSPE